MRAGEITGQKEKGRLRKREWGQGGATIGGEGRGRGWRGKISRCLQLPSFYNLRQKVMSSSVISGIGFGCYFRLVSRFFSFSLVTVPFHSIRPSLSSSLFIAFPSLLRPFTFALTVYFSVVILHQGCYLEHPLNPHLIANRSTCEPFYMSLRHSLFQCD